MALRIKKYQHKQNNAILRKTLELEINKNIAVTNLKLGSDEAYPY